jgi:AMMECR1 domain-containing protein
MEDVHVPSESQNRLVRLARWTLEDFVCCAQRQKKTVDDPYLQNRGYGAFVTLHKGNELRGCIGTCTPSAPLYQTVVDMTEAAARDHRVTPISKDELNHIRIDISVLSLLETVHDPLSLQPESTGFTSHKARNAVFFFRKSRRNIVGTLKLFWNRLVSKLVCRRMRGKSPIP